MKLIILGAAAGGGFPQWNCGCGNCRRARTGDPAARKRTQAGIAVSADGESWLLVNASPDLREQIGATPALHPRDGLRDSPIDAVALTGGEIDFTAGLLNLREGHRFGLYGTERVLGRLDANPVFRVLEPTLVPRRQFAIGETVTVTDGAGSDLGLTLRAFHVPGKVPLYAEGESGEDFAVDDGDTIGLEISAADSVLLYVPGCARLTDELRQLIAGAPLVLFDGTLWRDDEMVSLGLSAKTGARMGHMSAVDTIAAFADLGVARKVFVHVNNSNPMIVDDSPERAEAERAGWIIAHDGMEIAL
jgi:pyrroloquinoline quinone biosynthesis protein B